MLSLQTPLSHHSDVLFYLCQQLLQVLGVCPHRVAINTLAFRTQSEEKRQRIPQLFRVKCVNDHSASRYATQQVKHSKLHRLHVCGSKTTSLVKV